MIKRELAVIDKIKPVGEDGMSKATITIGGHGRAMTIIGKDLNQLVERCYKVINAFNGS